MTRFEPRTSGIGSDRSSNWATTTAVQTICLLRLSLFPSLSLSLLLSTFWTKIFIPESLKRQIPTYESNLSIIQLGRIQRLKSFQNFLLVVSKPIFAPSFEESESFLFRTSSKSVIKI